MNTVKMEQQAQTAKVASPRSAPRSRRRPRNEGRGVPAVSIVVPAKDEEENLPLLFEKFNEQMSRRRLRGEVILVDDGSSDGTYEVARAGAAQYRWLRVKRHATNLGLTAALKTGFDAARNDIMLFWPADLQYLPEDIPAMVDKFGEGFDVVTGWKQGKYGLKRFVSVIYNFASRILFKVKVHDLNSVKGFRREVIDKIPWRKDWHRYMVVWAAEAGFRITEVKVKLYPRYRGTTKFSLWRIPVGVLDLLAVKFQMSFLRKPLLFFGTWGMSLIGLGVVVGGIALYLRFVLQEGYRPLLYLVMLLETIGVLLFAIGFLAEAIVDLGDRTQSQIDSLRETENQRRGRNPERAGRGRGPHPRADR
jgi:glycosyltransferase involved in cell wall biosynthesis